MFRSGSADSAVTGFEIDLYHNMEGLDTDAWNALAVDQHKFLHTEYLQAYMQSHEVDHDYWFAQFMKDGELKGIGWFMTFSFYGKYLFRYVKTNKEEKSSSWVAGFKKLFNKGLEDNSWKLLVNGNPFVTGEQGYAFKDEITRGTSFELILATLQLIKEQLEGKMKIDLTLIKDFPECEELELFRKAKMHPMQVQPNMLFPIKPNWTEFKSYTDELRAKYRVRARKVFSNTEHIERRELNLDEVEQHNERLDELYRKVESKAPFIFVSLAGSYVLKLKRSFGDRFKVFAYFIDEQIVAFQTCLFVNGHMEAHVVGFDNAQENTKSLYNKMLFDFVNEGIINNCTFISFGRTALEIKSTIGAVPEDLYLYMKAHKPLINRVMGSFLSIGKANPWQQRQPFKKEIPAVI